MLMIEEYANRSPGMQCGVHNPAGSDWLLHSLLNSTWAVAFKSVRNQLTQRYCIYLVLILGYVMQVHGEWRPVHSISQRHQWQPAVVQKVHSALPTELPVTLVVISMPAI